MVESNISFSKFQVLNRFALLIPFLLLLLSCNDKSKQEYFTSERPIIESHFTGSESCKECHEIEYNLWIGSHHQLAMQVASDSSVLGDFNNKSFQSKGVDYLFFQKDGNYMVNTVGEDGKYHDFPIKFTFGFTPLQQYIIEFEKGNHQCLLVAWDSDSLKWFNLQPNLDIHHEEWMHWTGGSMTWNNMCADCHSTFVKKNYNTLQKSYSTTFTEINVGCESCHGPGDLHVEYYESEEKNKDYKAPEFYMPKSMTSQEIVQKCARCHSRRSMHTEVFDYKGHFLDHYYPSLLHYPTYEKDGQILDEDYVYASFMQSKMYHNKISCRDCHDMHSMELRLKGNTLCLLCHEPSYNSYEHHFHKMDTEASQCVNCHMTGRYYMGNDFRRDHSFRNPRPDQTIAYGTPNACNACHDEQSAKWAVQFIREKYGEVRPDHFSDRLLAGIEGNTDSLISLLQNRKFPAIARATAIQYFASQISDQSDLDLLSTLLKDSSALVRREACIFLGEMGPSFRFQIEGMLDDSIRAVRIAAARFFVLQEISTESEAFERAEMEFLKDLEVNADFASGMHQLALIHQTNGQVELAETAYREALQIDNYFNLSRMNLAILEYEGGNAVEAERLYLKVIEQEPDYSYPWFMLGLLYHETGQGNKSLEYLEQACEREPFLIRAHYNYAIKLIDGEKFSKALRIINNALENDHDNESLLYLRILVYMKTNDLQKAKEQAEKLIRINPENANYQGIYKELNG